MESLTSSFHRRRKKVKAASTACLQIFFLFPLGTKTFHSPLSTSGGEMLYFGVVITEKSESELSFNTEIAKLINISRKDWGRREALTQAVNAHSF